MALTAEQRKNVAVKIVQAICDGSLVVTSDGRRVEAARVKNGRLEIFIAGDGGFNAASATGLNIASYVKKETLHEAETEPEKEATK